MNSQQPKLQVTLKESKTLLPLMMGDFTDILLFDHPFHFSH